MPLQPRPANKTLQDLADLITQKQGDAVIGTDIAFGELTVEITPASVPDFVEFLKTDRECRFSTLIDITAVDYPTRDKRFDVVWHFLSMYQNHRIRVRARVRESDMVPSIVEVYPAANWFEREVFDMYGLMFKGHPDLRRILTDYGFRGYPLRKDFPLAGKPTETPEVAFTDPAPLEGGPFVTVAGGDDSIAREPRVRVPEEE